MSNEVTLITLAAGFGILLSIFSLRQIVYGRSHHERVLKDGGSPLFAGKFLMDFAYWMIHPVGQWLIRSKITPNMISLFCLLVSLAAGAVLATGDLFLAGLIWIFGSSMDALDGVVARGQGKVSAYGSVLDSTIDRVAELSMLSGLIFFFREKPWMVAAALAALWGSVLTSYISAKGDILKIQLPRGLMRRAERAVYLGLALIVSPFWDKYVGRSVEGLDPLPLFLVLSLIGAMSIVSSVLRLLWLGRELRRLEK